MRSTSQSPPTQSAISVFARIRPLTAKEISSPEKPTEILQGLALQSSREEEDSQNNAVVLDSSAPIGGYTAILGQEALNRDVFERCFARRLKTVLQGGTASLFAFGYTGGGKTHTVIGYGEEKGLFFLAAEKLLQELHDLPHGNKQEESRGCTNDDEENHEEIFLEATACEIYNDKVYDLLGEEKVECSLRTDHTGQLCIGRLMSTQLKLDENIKTPPVKPGDHATLLTVDVGLRSVSVHHAQDLQEIHQTCVAQRACGTSTTHHQSSRSHAILRLQVVNRSVLQAKRQVERIKAEIAPLKNAADNAQNETWRTLYDGYSRVLRAKEDDCPHVKEGDWVLVEDGQESSVKGSHASALDRPFCLQGHDKDDAARTAEQWAETLDHPGPLEVKWVFLKKELPGGAQEWEQRRNTLKQIAETLAAKVHEKEAEATAAEAHLNSTLTRSPKAIGGSMLLVDLAGADYDHRTGKAQRESAAINKSLLALKECFRSMSKPNPNGDAVGASSKTKVTSKAKAKPNFRASKLTRILEDTLSPGIHSQRRNNESCSVMLVNVSPSAELEKATVNALRYGQMFSGDNRVIGKGGRTLGSGITLRGRLSNADAPKKPWQRQ